MGCVGFYTSPPIIIHIYVFIICTFSVPISTRLSNKDSGFYTLRDGVVTCLNSETFLYRPTKQTAESLDFKMLVVLDFVTRI